MGAGAPAAAPLRAVPPRDPRLRFAFGALSDGAADGSDLTGALTGELAGDLTGDLTLAAGPAVAH